MQGYSQMDQLLGDFSRQQDIWAEGCCQWQAATVLGRQRLIVLSKVEYVQMFA